MPVLFRHNISLFSESLKYIIMKTFKYFDAWFSCLLIISFSIMGFTNRDETFIYGYFYVGGWQVISMIVHSLNGWFTPKGSSRYLYHWAVLILFFIALLSLVYLPLLMLLLLIMVFTGPFMAIFYTVLCFNEIKLMNQRPLDLLK